LRRRKRREAKVAEEYWCATTVGGAVRLRPIRSSVLVFVFQLHSLVCIYVTDHMYWGADKSLARPGRKKARKHVRDARDFNNIETRAVIKFFFSARQGAEGNSRHSDRNISLFPSWSGYGHISTPVYNQFRFAQNCICARLSSRSGSIYIYI